MGCRRLRQRRNRQHLRKELARGSAGRRDSARLPANRSPAAHKTALGYARASVLGLSVGSGFHGASIVNPSDALVAYVLEGDPNLDGVVNALNFIALSTGFGQN